MWPEPWIMTFMTTIVIKHISNKCLPGSLSDSMDISWIVFNYSDSWYVFIPTVSSLVYSLQGGNRFFWCIIKGIQPSVIPGNMPAKADFWCRRFHGYQCLLRSLYKSYLRGGIWETFLTKQLILGFHRKICLMIQSFFLSQFFAVTGSTTWAHAGPCTMQFLCLYILAQ